MTSYKKKVYRCSGLLLLLGLLGASAFGCRSCQNQHAIDVDGMKRTFRLHVPASYDGTTPVPLLLVLHQFTDTARGMQKLTGFDAIADTEGFIVAYPQGRFRRWNTSPSGRTGDLAFLLALIDWVAAHYNLDERRVYATGASAGGMMSQYLARNTDRIAAIAPVMGAVQPAVLDSGTHSGPVPVLMIHGTADPVVPYGVEGTLSNSGPHGAFLSVPDNIARWAELNGCDNTPEIVPLSSGDCMVDQIVYSCAEGAETILYRVEGGGHTWPGRKNRYPAFIVGKTCMNLDASRAIWDFFARQSRPIP